MGKVLISIPEGKYENEDAVENVIHYIMRLNEECPIGGYNVYPLETESIIQQFYAVKKAYGAMGGKQIMHIIISVDKTFFFDETNLKRLGQLMAGYFQGRQVVFAVHNDTEQLHIHMGINTVSFMNGSYKGFWEIEDLKKYALKCVNLLADEVWFGKKTIDFWGISV